MAKGKTLTIELEDTRPSQVVVHGWPWEIVWTDDHHMLDQNFAGVSVFNNRTIVIRPNQTDANLRETLLHEVLHAIWYETHLADPPPSEEVVVTVVARSLLRVLLDNPEVTSWLMS